MLSRDEIKRIYEYLGAFERGDIVNSEKFSDICLLRRRNRYVDEFLDVKCEIFSIKQAAEAENRRLLRLESRLFELEKRIFEGFCE